MMKSSGNSNPTDDALIGRLRELCLALPETTETNSWNHPNFRAGKRTFVTFERIGGQSSFAFRLPETNVAALLEGKEFFAPPYGRGQWVSLRAEGTISWSVVEELVVRAYRTVALRRMITALDAADEGS